MSYAKFLSKYRRGAILEYLTKTADNTSPVAILVEVVNGLDIRSTFDQVVTDLRWLRGNGFVTMDSDHAYSAVEITREGKEIALGRAKHSEVTLPDEEA